MGLKTANLAATAKRCPFPVELDVTDITGSAVGAMVEVPIGHQTEPMFVPRFLPYRHCEYEENASERARLVLKRSVVFTRIFDSFPN